MSNPPPIIYPPSPSRPSRIRRMWPTLAVVGFIFACFILCCSGLNIPVINPQSNLRSMLKEDFDVSLPPSLRVLHAARTAMRDPAKHFVCEINPMEFDSLRIALNAAAARLQYDAYDPTTENRVSFGPPPPEWYDVDKFPTRVGMTYFIKPPKHYSGTGYWFFFVPATNKLYIFWWST